MVFVFFIPLFQRFIPWIIAMIVLNWILEWDFKRKTQRLFSDISLRYNLLFSVLYLLYLGGLLYTSNVERGLFDLEVKFSLILFPVMISSLPQEIILKKFKNRIFSSFVYGSWLATFICIIVAINKFIDSHSSSEFFYTKLSLFLHPGYFSIYLNFAVAILVYYLFEGSSNTLFRKKFLIYFLIAWFFVFIVLLSSKAGIISLAIILIICSLYYYLKRRKLLKSSMLIAGIALMFFMSYLLFPRSYGRLKTAAEVISNTEEISADTEEGTGERILIWKASLEIIKNNFLIGTGTGDVKDELMKQYTDKRISTARARSLNAHNQYLQTFIALGIGGVVVLILMIVIPAISAMKHDSIIYFLFIIIIAFNFLVESALETQAGVVFYAFFNSYLFVTKKRL